MTNIIVYKHIKKIYRSKYKLKKMNSSTIFYEKYKRRPKLFEFKVEISFIIRVKLEDKTI